MRVLVTSRNLPASLLHHTSSAAFPSYLAYLTMQNLPNKLIVKISESLSLAELQNLASTCKNYYDMFHKDIKDLRFIEKVLKHYYYRFRIIDKANDSIYIFYVYNTKKAL
jgi:hypothetical protein